MKTIRYFGRDMNIAEYNLFKAEEGCGNKVKLGGGLRGHYCGVLMRTGNTLYCLDCKIKIKQLENELDKRINKIL